jgi:phosphoglycolate phosphatase
MKTELVIFDLDGTLVDTADEIARAINFVLRQEGLPPLSLEAVRGVTGDGARAAVAKAYALSEARLAGDEWTSSLPHRELLDRLMEAYAFAALAQCGANSTVFPQVHATLASLRARNIKLAIVTNKERIFARALLAAHELLEWFDPIVCGDALPERKPEPAPVNLCLTYHGVPPECALMVGDSHRDVRAARSAGVRSLLTCYGYHASESASCTPDAWLSSFADILQHVDVVASGVAKPVPSHGSSSWAHDPHRH